MEKRRYRRLECSIPVKVRKIPSVAGEPPKEYVIRNLGPEGAFIEGDELFEQDTLLELEFPLESSPDMPEGENIRATAVVRWRRDVENHRGMGVQFLKVSEFGKQKISVFIIRKILEYRQELSK